MKQLLQELDGIIANRLSQKQADKLNRPSLTKAIALARQLQIIFLQTALDTSKQSKLKILVQVA